MTTEQERNPLGFYESQPVVIKSRNRSWVTTREILDDADTRAKLMTRLRNAGLVYNSSSGGGRKTSTTDLRELVELAERIAG